MNIPEHITDLKRGDFEEIARAANPVPGIGMEINRKKGSIEFAISVTQLKRMMWAFYRNGGFQAATMADLYEIPLDIS